MNMVNDSNVIDLAIGKRLRARRVVIGISQEDMGKAVGVSFQQIQKYEKGQNKLSASRLYDFSIFLGVDVSYFYEDIAFCNKDNGEKPPLHEEQDIFDHKVDNKEIMTLVRSYSAIDDPNIRKKILSLIKSL